MELGLDQLSEVNRQVTETRLAVSWIEADTEIFSVFVYDDSGTPFFEWISGGFRGQSETFCGAATDLACTTGVHLDSILAILESSGIAESFPGRDGCGCDYSDRRETVFIGGTDTGAPNIMFADGTTLTDRVAQALSEARNKGRFVRYVSRLTRRLVRARQLTFRERWAILRVAIRVNWR